MTNWTELKRLAESIKEGCGLQGADAEEAMFNFECAATPETILALIAENERLRGDVRMLVRQHMPLQALEGMEGWSEVVEARKAVEQRDQLRAEVEALRKDAERYRHLKDQGHFRAMSIDMGGNHSWTGMGRHVGKGQTVDEAIDSEIARIQA